jgi:hypothetical protein
MLILYYKKIDLKNSKVRAERIGLKIMNGRILAVTSSLVENYSKGIRMYLSRRKKWDKII